MAIWQKQDGVWRSVKEPRIKVGEAWRHMKEVYLKENGVWRLVWPPSSTGSAFFAQFSGGFITGPGVFHNEPPLPDIEIIVTDGPRHPTEPYGEYLILGEYPHNLTGYLHRSHVNTFDSMLIPEGIRVIFYSQHGYLGTVLFDGVGPAIIYNNLWNGHDHHGGVLTNSLGHPDLDARFPNSVKQWSDSNMHSWVGGSLKIMRTIGPPYVI